MIDFSLASNATASAEESFSQSRDPVLSDVYLVQSDAKGEVPDSSKFPSIAQPKINIFEAKYPLFVNSNVVTNIASPSHPNFPVASSSHHPYGIKYIGMSKHPLRHKTSNFYSQWMLTKKFQQRRGACFVFTVILFIGFQYFSYAILMLPSVFHSGVLGVAYVVVFHIFFSLMLTAFIQTSLTDPGVVPANWGFYMGDEGKRRRYCKICHAWKPDRTHHCSACGRCVLNMDHHCPWVNNCIGFANRKFFIQLLCYALVCIVLTIIHGTHFLFNNGSHLIPDPMDVTRETFLFYFKDVAVFACSVIMLLFAVLLGIPLIPFTKFHLTMIARNSSTIENMDTLNRTRDLYDLGTSRNLHQVLGPNWFLWWLPFHVSCSKPVGDGVRWRQQYWRTVES